MSSEGAAGLATPVAKPTTARAPTAKATAAPRKSRKVRAFWLKQLHTWHWISAAISLVGMLLFAITGITLNHAGSIASSPYVTHREARLPPPLLRLLAAPHPADAPLPAAIVSSLEQRLHIDAGGRAAEWSDDEAYVSMPGPGRDAWVSIDRKSGVATAEITDRGWISYLNDLHKGRNTGSAWSWFIDLFAVACILFTATGLLLLQMHARHRPATWPLVGLGLAIPFVLALLFIH